MLSPITEEDEKINETFSFTYLRELINGRLGAHRKKASMVINKINKYICIYINPPVEWGREKSQV